MKNWHKYLMGENSLFAERYFVYMGGEKTPQPKAPEAAKGKPGEGEKPPTLEDVKKKIAKLKDDINQAKEKYRGAAGKSEKLKALNKKITEIEKKLKDIEKAGAQKKQEIITAVNNQLDSIINQMPGQKKIKRIKAQPVNQPKTKPAGKVETGKNKPSSNKEKAQSAVEKNKQILSKYLDDIAKNPDKFSKLRSYINLTISTLCREMGVDLNNVKKGQFVNLPGGYRMAIHKWKNNQDKMPNAIIYKGKELVCYRDYGVLRQGNSGMELGNRQAQMIKCLDQFPKTFTVSNNKFRVLNKENFAMLAIDITRYSAQKQWSENLSNCRISYNPSNKQITLVARGVPGKIVFNPSDPHNIRMVPEGKTSSKAVDISTYQESPKEKKARKNEEIKRQEKKVEQAKAKIRLEQAKRKKQLEADRKKIEKKALRDKVSKSINSKFKKLVKLGKESNSFTVKAEKNDRKGLRLINNTKIHELLSLTQNKREVVMITLKGPKGPRKAMYYPGQKTAYEVDSKGKQTNNRVKFYNGDTITLDFKDPESKDYANLNRDKKVSSPEKIIGNELAHDLGEKIQEFKKLKGKLSDLDLKPLNKYKNIKGYDPKNILNMSNWAGKKGQELLRRIGNKKAIQILEDEFAVIHKGLVKINPVTEDGGLY